MNDNLSPDELEALLGHVDSGDLAGVDDHLIEDKDVQPYDLCSDDVAFSGQLPMIDKINDRFARMMKEGVATLLGRPIETGVVGVTFMKYSEYIRRLHLPSNMNLMKIEPLNGKAMIVIDPRFIHSLVDLLFGGDGSYKGEEDGREFTPTEHRISSLFLQVAFDMLKQAWNPVYKMDFSFISTESNPKFVNIAAPTEVVMVSRFGVDVGDVNGEFNIVIPNIMLEPLRELLDNEQDENNEQIDQRWMQALTTELKSAVVEIDCQTAHKRLTLGDVLRFRTGDVIQVELPELITVRAAKTPVFKGQLGVSNGRNAIRYIGPVVRSPYEQNQ